MHKLLLVSQPRSGTNLLLLALNKHPDIKMYYELFHRDYYERSGPHGIDTGFSGKLYFNQEGDPKSFLNHHVWNKENQKFKYVGFKLLSGYIDNVSYDVATKIAEFQDIKCLFLKRESILDMYISAKIAAQTNRWIQYVAEGESEVQVEKIEIDYSDFLNAYDYTISKRQHFETIFTNHQQLKITYMDLVENFEKNLERIFDFLEVDNCMIEPVTKKQRTFHRSEYVKNMEEILDKIKKNNLIDAI